METLIIIGLLIIILLILTNRYKITINPKNPEVKQLPNQLQENVMGTAKFSNHQSFHSDIGGLQPQQDETLIRVSDPLIPDVVDDSQAEGDYNDDSAWIDEEEELGRYSISTPDNSLAQGVTFEELLLTGAFLQHNRSDHSQNKTVVEVLQQLEGTDLFHLLETSVEGAAQKIASLLDNALSSEVRCASSIPKENWNQFNIDDFK